MQLDWLDTPRGAAAASNDGTLRVVWHDGEQFVCDWTPDEKPMERWLLDPVPDLAAAKAVVESWETPQGWEDDDDV